MVNTTIVPADRAALDYGDCLKPGFKDKISLTHPNDDDAVLFNWKLAVDRYGWDWVASLMAQHPTFFRGTPQGAGPVFAGQAANFAAFIPPAGIPGLPVMFAVPKTDQSGPRRSTEHGAGLPFVGFSPSTPTADLASKDVHHQALPIGVPYSPATSTMAANMSGE